MELTPSRHQLKLFYLGILISLGSYKDGISLIKVTDTLRSLITVSFVISTEILYPGLYSYTERTVIVSS